ncbi:MAG: glycoside hydrolase family 2 TIM barrel-domain containing protein [Christensenellales bacterium]
MLYKIAKNNSLKPTVFQDNKLKPRSYFIPFPSQKAAKETSISAQRRESGKIVLLNGEWDFAYFAQSSKLNEIDTEKDIFDKVIVPSCWQTQDYEPHCYLKNAYEFANRHPKVPRIFPAGEYAKEGQKPFKQYNSAGVYRKKFTLNKSEKRVLITFLGVAGSLEIYVNGKYAGYSEGGRAPAEFDITDTLVGGENELVAVVRKWSAGTYLESFDTFRMNGIFRDVYLTLCHNEHIFDVTVNTVKIEGKYNAYVNVKVHNNEKSNLQIVLEDNGSVIAKGSYYSAEEVAAEFTGLQVEEWSAERPYLYSLYITLVRDGAVKECIRKDIGFKHIEIADGRLRFNDALIKLKGVNYYEFDQLAGYCVSADDLERDLSLMKAYNVNAVYCPYPLDPLFYELADKLGLYVVAQAEIRASGSFAGLIRLKSRGLASYSGYIEHFKDRVLRLYHTCKNNACVLLYSIGDDAGGGKCVEEAFGALKAINYNIPIFYAGNAVVATKADSVACVKSADGQLIKRLAERTVPGNRLLTELIRKSPVILANMASGKGVGTGGLEELMDTVYANDNIIGGFVADFADQNIYSLDNNAKYRHIYGGDSGEYKHNGTECLRGMFYADRKPKPFAYYCRKVFSPVKTKYSGNEIIVRNTDFFSDTSQWQLSLQPVINSHPNKETALPQAISPQTSLPVKIDLPDDAFDVFVNLKCVNPFGGEYIYQQAVKEMMLQLDITGGDEISLIDFPNQAKIYFKGGFVEFDKRFGAVIKYNVNGYDYIKTEPLKKKGTGSISAEIYRAPLANDYYIKHDWLRAGYRDFTINTRYFDIQIQEGQAKVEAEIDFIVDNKEKLCGIKSVYTVHSSGRIDVDCSMEPGRNMPPLPRFGNKLQLQYELQKVEYYGRGPVENFADMKSHCPMGVYNCEVNDFYEPYIKPQDSGYREDTRYAIFRNPRGAGLMFLAQNKPFVLNAQYTESAKIEGFTHREDVVTESTVYVSIDSFVRGTGAAGASNQRTSLQYSIIPLSVGIFNAREYAKIKSIIPVQTQEEK